VRLRSRSGGHGRGGRLGLDRLLLFGWSENRVQDGAFHARHELNNSDLANVLDELVNDVIAQVAVSHLAAAEAQAGLDLVAAGKEFDRLVLLGRALDLFLLLV